MSDPKPRSFNCPETGVACLEGGCKRDNICIIKQRIIIETAEAEARARQERIRLGKATAEDLGL